MTNQRSAAAAAAREVARGPNGQESPSKSLSIPHESRSAPKNAYQQPCSARRFGEPGVEDGDEKLAGRPIARRRSSRPSLPCPSREAGRNRRVPQCPPQGE